MAWMLGETMANTLAAALTSAVANLILKQLQGVMMANDRCMINGCQRPAGARTRGLCLTCYSKAKAKIESGEATWARLAELGLCRPDESRDPFDDAYSKALEDN